MKDNNKLMGKDDADALAKATSEYLSGGKPFSAEDLLDKAYRITEGRHGQAKDNGIAEQTYYVVKNAAKGFLNGLYTPFLLPTFERQLSERRTTCEQAGMTRNEAFRSEAFIKSYSQALVGMLTYPLLLGAISYLLPSEIQGETRGTLTALWPVSNGIDLLAERWYKRKRAKAQSATGQKAGGK